MRLFKKFFIILMVVCLVGIPAMAEEGEHDGYIVKYRGMDEVWVESVPIILFSAADAVEYIIPNVYFELYGTTPHYDYDSQAGWDTYIDYAAAWKLGCYGQGVRVGVIDSGVYQHEDLSGSIVEGYNFKTKTTDTNDTLGHGTFVSGIIAANWNGEGINGIAKDSKIVPLKCFNTSSDGTLKDICSAIRAAVDTYDCDVINMSFGIEEQYLNFVNAEFGNMSALDYLKNAVDYALSKGAILVAAVGNAGSETLNYPAAIDGVIGVGSVSKVFDEENNKTVVYKTGISNYNESVFVVAPGEDVTSLGINSYLVGGTGTSYSTPAVSALAALTLCAKPQLTREEFMTLLSQSARKKTEEYNVNLGHGIINPSMLFTKLLENDSAFVSPPIKDGDNLYIRVYNKSGTSMNFRTICFQNENQQLGNIKSLSVTNFLHGNVVILPLGLYPQGNQIKNVLFCEQGNFFQPVLNGKIVVRGE